MKAMTWKARYHRAARHYITSLSVGTEYTAEQVRLAIRDDIGEPETPNDWSAQATSLRADLMRDGLIEFTGNWQPMQSAKSHGNQTRVYVRTNPLTSIAYFEPIPDTLPGRIDPTQPVQLEFSGYSYDWASTKPSTPPAHLVPAEPHLGFWARVWRFLFG